MRKGLSKRCSQMHRQQPRSSASAEGVPAEDGALPLPGDLPQHCATLLHLPPNPKLQYKVFPSGHASCASPATVSGWECQLDTVTSVPQGPHPAQPPPEQRCRDSNRLAPVPRPCQGAKVAPLHQHAAPGRCNQRRRRSPNTNAIPAAEDDGV